jgi:hypothetical protein
LKLLLEIFRRMGIWSEILPTETEDLIIWGLGLSTLPTLELEHGTSVHNPTNGFEKGKQMEETRVKP